MVHLVVSQRSRLQAIESSRISQQVYSIARSLKDAWADPTTPHGRLMPTILGGPDRELSSAVASNYQED
jgi:hypothetical protein